MTARWFGILLPATRRSGIGAYLVWLALSHAWAPSAEAGWSLTVQLTTDYIVSRVPEAATEPALQFDLAYQYDNGFYVGLWASSIDFDENAGIEDPAERVDSATVELGPYVGRAGAFGNGVTWDIAATSYLYPGAESTLQYDYWELTSGIGYRFEQARGQPWLSLEAAYTPDYFGGAGSAYTLAGQVVFNLPAALRLRLRLARQLFATDVYADYYDAEIALARTVAGFEVDLAYRRLEYADSDCGVDEFCGDYLVVTVSRTF